MKISISKKDNPENIDIGINIDKDIVKDIDIPIDIDKDIIENIDIDNDSIENIEEIFGQNINVSVDW